MLKRVARFALAPFELTMYEHHENEQYFFDKPTLAHLADFVSGYDNPCCVCAPLLGQELVRREVRVRILDIDERFAHLSGFRRYDIYRPEWLGEEFVALAARVDPLIGKV